MAVFTKATSATLGSWLEKNYGLILEGDPVPIAEGIENTNYIVNAKDRGKHVFTVFEVWDKDTVTYCLSLATHLNNLGLPIPRTLPMAKDSQTCAEYEKKPAAVVEFVEGKAIRNPGEHKCETIGACIARMHAGVADFAPVVENQRGFAWREKIIPKIKESLDKESLALLDEAFEIDRHVSSAGLGKGACHCDLFRNNVLWQGCEVAGIIDFYFAGHDSFLFDLAVSAVDWTMDDLGTIDPNRLSSMLKGFLGVRGLNDMEREMLPGMMASAALRFWLSRINDLQNPRPSHQLVAHDPAAFRHRLRSCLDNKSAISEALDRAQA